jgi:hypothetical protein
MSRVTPFITDDLMFVLHRFQAVKNDNHSSGAVYITILNNPRAIRHRREETVLLMMIPGPNEPNSEQMNNIMSLLVSHFVKLGKGDSPVSLKHVHLVLTYIVGSEFRVHGHLQREVVHTNLHSNISDLPATRKITGLMSHSSKLFMCPDCKTPFYALTNPSAFDPQGEHTGFYEHLFIATGLR